jgi:hypothetical protein
MRVANQRHLSEDRDPGPDSFFHLNAVSDPEFLLQCADPDDSVFIIVMQIWDH